MKGMKKGLLIFGAMLMNATFVFPAYAQQDVKEVPISVQLSPVRYDWSIKSGEDKIGIINLKNYLNEPYKVDITVEDFYLSDNTENMNFFVPDAKHPFEAYDVINWVSTADWHIVLDANESRDIPFKVSVPKNTATGGYYGAMFFQYEPQNPAENAPEGAARLKVNTRVGLLLTIAVDGSGPIIKKGNLRLFESESNIFWDKSAKIKAEFENTGNVPFKTSGMVDIFRGSKKVTSFPVDTNLNYPGKFRIYDFVWDFKPWDIGKYQAKIHIESEDGSIVGDKELTFLVIPWKALAAVVAVIFVFWLIFIFGKKSGKKEIKKK